MKKLVNILDCILVILSLIVAAYVAKNIGLEYLFRGKEQTVSLAETEEALAGTYLGLPAGEDIPRIESIQDWEDTYWDISSITIEPIDIVSTGIGKLHPWINQTYSSGRHLGRRKKAEIAKTFFDPFNDYAEYYLLQLKDSSYIVAQIPVEDARKLKKGDEITLPIGQRTALNYQAAAAFKETADQYKANTDGVFYCINDQWNESNYFMLFISRVGVGLVLVLALSVTLITLFHKLFRIKES